MLPNFIVIGAAKSGTTSICDLLSSHNDIFFSNPKEPRYFSDPEKYGNPDFTRSYEALFSGVTSETAVGEGTTNYSHPEMACLVAERIRVTIPACRIVFVVRHPVRRIESDWRMRHFEQWAPANINDAVTENDSLLAHSLYYKNLAPYIERFDQDRIHIIFLEEFSNSPQSVMERCFSFLEVDPNVQLHDPERKRNDSSNFRRYGRLASVLRNNPIAIAIRDNMPGGAVAITRRLLTKELPFEPTWNEKTLTEVHSRLVEDTQKLLSYAGKDSDYWGPELQSD